MPVHEIDGPSSAAFGRGLRLDRFAVADGIDLWIAEGNATQGHRLGVSSHLLEIDFQLAGESTLLSHRAPPHCIGAGELHHLDPGETYGMSYGSHGLFVEMGITVDPVVVGAHEPGRDLRIRAAGLDRELRDLFVEAHRLRSAGAPLPCAAIADTIRRYVARAGTLSAADPIARARQLVERHFDAELYLAHVADEVGLTEIQLLRRFARRYGTTPIRYRSNVRLDRAARLAWAHPDLTTRELAERSGFRHLAYFHRSYRRYFGTTPALHRRG